MHGGPAGEDVLFRSHTRVWGPRGRDSENASDEPSAGGLTISLIISYYWPEAHAARWGDRDQPSAFVDYRYGAATHIYNPQVL